MHVVCGNKVSSVGFHELIHTAQLNQSSEKVECAKIPPKEVREPIRNIHQQIILGSLFILYYHFFFIHGTQCWENHALRP